jgi:hypothetical protein
MSSFRTINAGTVITDKRCLVDTLKHMGYAPVVEDGQTVRGDTRYDNRNGYDIVLKKEDTSLRGDIGFQQKDGFFNVGMDSFIIREFTPEAFVKKVSGEYIETKAKATAKKLGLRVLDRKEVKVDGRTITRYRYEKVGA